MKNTEIQNMFFEIILAQINMYSYPVFLHYCGHNITWTVGLSRVKITDEIYNKTFKRSAIKRVVGYDGIKYWKRGAKFKEMVTSCETHLGKSI